MSTSLIESAQQQTNYQTWAAEVVGRSFSVWSPMLFGNQNAQLETRNWFLPALLNEGQQL